MRLQPLMNPYAVFSLLLILAAVPAAACGQNTVQPNTGTKKNTFRKQGKLTKDDPLDVIRTRSRFQVVPFKMFKGKVYTIDLTGNYDPYLRIEDSLGNNRAQNDDGGVGLNSKLIFRPEETDTYRIIVTAFSTRFGAYTLTVKE